MPWPDATMRLQQGRPPGQQRVGEAEQEGRPAQPPGGAGREGDDPEHEEADAQRAPPRRAGARRLREALRAAEADHARDQQQPRQPVARVVGQAGDPQQEQPQAERDPDDLDHRGPPVKDGHPRARSVAQPCAAASDVWPDLASTPPSPGAAPALEIWNSSTPYTPWAYGNVTVPPAGWAVVS